MAENMHAVDSTVLPVERLKEICVDSQCDSFTGRNRRTQTDKLSQQDEEKSALKATRGVWYDREKGQERQMYELNIPSVVSIRGNDIIRDVFQAERFPYLKWALENATQFTAVSWEGLNRARILSACPSKGRVILNSIRPQDFTEGTQDLQLPRPVIGSLAVFKNKKGLEVLLCAFNMLLQHYPTAHLLLVGFVVSSVA